MKYDFLRCKISTYATPISCNRDASLKPKESYFSTWLLVQKRIQANSNNLQRSALMAAFVLGINPGNLLIPPQRAGNETKLGPRQNGHHFTDDNWKCLFLNENRWILNAISLKFVSSNPINNIPALVQIMPWRRPGDKSLFEPMMVSLLTHIWVTWPQWVEGK